MDIDNLLASALPDMGNGAVCPGLGHTNHNDSNQNDKDAIMCDMVDGIKD